MPQAPCQPSWASTAFSVCLHLSQRTELRLPSVTHYKGLSLVPAVGVLNLKTPHCCGLYC